MKKTFVELEHPGLGVVNKYEISHAERILRMPNNGGWRLPKDSNYIFDVDNGIRVKPNKAGNNGAEEKAAN